MYNFWLFNLLLTDRDFQIYFIFSKTLLLFYGILIHGFGLCISKNFLFVCSISKGFEKNFDSYGPDRMDSAEEPYDFDSLMHYDNQAFSKNGDNTLQSISDPNRHLGNMDDFSTIDIKQLLKDYPCKPWDKKPAVNGGTKKDNSEESKQLHSCRRPFQLNSQI